MHSLEAMKDHLTAKVFHHHGSRKLILAREQKFRDILALE